LEEVLQSTLTSPKSKESNLYVQILRLNAGDFFVSAER